MKLLHFEGEGIDEILMIVPDEHDKKYALEQARDFMDSAHLTGEYDLEIPPVSLWEYREAMRKARALGKSGSNELVLAELIRQQRQIEAESRGLTKAERRTRERKGTLKGTNSAVSTTEGLRPIDTGDTSRPLFKVERW